MDGRVRWDREEPAWMGGTGGIVRGLVVALRDASADVEMTGGNNIED